MAGIQDAEGITTPINAAFRKAEAFFIDRNRIDVESVRGLLGKGKFLLAEEGDVLVGCVYLEPRGDRAYLGLLSVDPGRQNVGLGSLLMNAAEERCAQDGFRMMELRIVNLRTENQAFYRHRGYVETGTEPFPADLNPRLPCHFVTMVKALG